MDMYSVMFNVYAILLSKLPNELNESDNMLKTQLATTLIKHSRNCELALDISYDYAIEQDIKMKKQQNSTN